MFFAGNLPGRKVFKTLDPEACWASDGSAVKIA
jgi:hypothetical protein